MGLRRYFGVLYGILVVLIVAIAIWWIVFLTQEGRTYEQLQIQRMTTDRIHAEEMIRSVPEIKVDPAGKLGGTYPHLLFHETADGVRVEIDPAAIASVKKEARSRQRMFTAEGIFFLLLLGAGTTILTLAYRSERDFKRARELFLTGATHELKTPLASLHLYTETLDRPELEGGDRSRIRACMLKDIQRLETLVEQILALGYEEEETRSQRTTLNLAEEVRTVLAEMDGFLRGHQTTVETDLPSGHYIRGNRFIFALVLRNLLSNAVLHSPSPVRVVVTLNRSGPWIRLAVRDWGPGIGRADRKRIFKEFLRGEGVGNSEPDLEDKRHRPIGAGLGLYLVKRKVEMMGGDVELESEVGKGSVFTLILPATEKEQV